MSALTFKAQIKSAAYGLVAMGGAEKAIAVLREVMAEITKDSRVLGDDDSRSGQGSR